MNCTYTIQGDGNTYSFKELVDKYKENVNDASDIIYSKEITPVQEKIVEQIKSASIQTKLEISNPSILDGEPNIGNDTYLNCQQFIDSPTFHDVAHITTLSREGYIQQETNKLINQQISSEEAAKIVQQEVDNWDTIGEDAALLHNKIASFDFAYKEQSDFIKAFEGTKFYLTSGELYNSLKKQRGTILKRIKDANYGNKSKVLTNINLATQVEEINKMLLGHIDMAVIDSAGTLHIYNYKIATKPLEEGSVKMQKYRYQLALIKQILSANGINVENASLHIIPIRVRYTDDCTKVISTEVHSERDLTVEGHKYVFNSYERIAQHFIPSSANVKDINDEDIDAVNVQLSAMFPEHTIKAQGMKQSAIEWIKHNRDSIVESNNPKYAYEVVVDGALRYIESNAKPEENEELINVLKKSQKELNLNNGIVLTRVIEQIIAGVTGGNNDFLTKKIYAKSGTYLHKTFSKYYATAEEQGKPAKAEWEIVQNDSLLSAGVLIFRHKKTGKTDVITLSNQDLNATIKLKRGSTILGSRLYDSQAGNVVEYKSTVGNIEAIRTALLINQVLPKLGKEFIFDSLKVISMKRTGQGLPLNLEEYTKKCVQPVIKELNKVQTIDIANNFIGRKYADQLVTLTTEYKEALKEVTFVSAEDMEYIEEGFGALESAESIEAKLNALRTIEAQMQRNFPNILNASKPDPHYRKIATLYKEVLKAITYYDVGNISTVQQTISTLDRQVFVSSRVPNRNFQIITELYNKAINRIAERAMDQWIPARSLFHKFYDDIGYSRLQNSVIGNQSSQFDDLYRKDSKGNKSLQLLNPYDENDMAQIKTNRTIKQQFLKRILFKFAQTRYSMLHIPFDFTSAEDPKLQDFINAHRDSYFNIPLERASTSTRRTKLSLQQKLQHLKEETQVLLRNPKKIVDEFINNIDSIEEADQREQNWQARQLSNKFILGEGANRQDYIDEHGTEFFETNLEILLADFIERDIETQEYNKTLVTVKGILFQLDLLGENPNLQQVVNQTTEMINDFIKTNIFHMSIMESTSQKITGWLTPLRRLVTDTLIAGNITGMLRDCFEGVWQNTMRTIIKYQTDISPDSLRKAYQTVMENSFTDGRSINIVNQLCQIYRLSNIDVSRISEGLKSGRGITNIGNWAFATLRRPDFLNRMALFVAKCYEDGVYDAFDIKEGKLIYNWKKDARFKAFAENDKSDMKKYQDAMGAYYNAIRAYNKEHPESTLTYQDNLPMPYSLQEVEQLKNTANTIYGSYDRSTKANYEHLALGIFFGQFSTWMNGLYSNYFMKPGLYYNADSKIEQDTDAQGNLKFFDTTGQIVIQKKDTEGNNVYFYESTNQRATDNLEILEPVMSRVPIVVQGIFYTLKQSGQALINGDFENAIWQDPMQRANLRKLFSDLLAYLLFGSFYSLIAGPAYSDFKKGMKDRPALVNGVVELLYKSSSRSYDGFKGVFNVFEYLGENVNPPTYSQNIKLLKDVGSVVLGKKTVSDALNGNVAVFKTFQDTWRASNKD